MRRTTISHFSLLISHCPFVSRETFLWRFATWVLSPFSKGLRFFLFQHDPFHANDRSIGPVPPPEERWCAAPKGVHFLERSEVVWFLSAFTVALLIPLFSSSFYPVFSFENHTTSLRLWKCTPSAFGFSTPMGRYNATAASRLFILAMLYELCIAPPLRTTHYALRTHTMFHVKHLSIGTTSLQVFLATGYRLLATKILIPNP